MAQVQTCTNTSNGAARVSILQVTESLLELRVRGR
jgi:hypothetical protein